MPTNANHPRSGRQTLVQDKGQLFSEELEIDVAHEPFRW